MFAVIAVSEMILTRGDNSFHVGGTRLSDRCPGMGRVPSDDPESHVSFQSPIWCPGMGRVPADDQDTHVSSQSPIWCLRMGRVPAAESVPCTGAFFHLVIHRMPLFFPHSKWRRWWWFPGPEAELTTTAVVGSSTAALPSFTANPVYITNRSFY